MSLQGQHARKPGCRLNIKIRFVHTSPSSGRIITCQRPLLADASTQTAAKKKRKSKKKVADKTVSSNELADTNAASNGTEDAEEAEGEGEEEELDASRVRKVEPCHVQY